MLATQVQQSQAQKQHRLVPSTPASNADPKNPTNLNFHSINRSSGPSHNHSAQPLLSNGTQSFSSPAPGSGSQSRNPSNPSPGTSGLPSFNFFPPGLLLPSFHPVMIPNFYAFNPIASAQSPLYNNHPQHHPADPNAPQSVLGFQNSFPNFSANCPQLSGYSPIHASAHSDAVPPGPNSNSAPQSPLLNPPHPGHPFPFLHHSTHPQPQQSHPQPAPLRLPYPNTRAHSAPPLNSSSAPAGPSPPTLASLALQPPSPVQMFAHRHEARDSEAFPGSLPRPSLSGHSGKTPRSASLSSQVPPQPPRPRTHSTQSDRPNSSSQYVVHRQSLAGVSQNPNAVSVTHSGSLRPRSDSPNSRPSTSPSHGFSNGPSSLTVKPPDSAGDSHHPFNPSRSHSNSPTSTHSASSTPTPPNLSHSRPSSPSQGNSNAPKPHSLSSHPAPHSGNMVRRPSPLARESHSSSPGPDSRPASKRFSHASTVTPSASHSPKGPSSGASGLFNDPSLNYPEADDQNDDDDEDEAAASSETASDTDHRQPGHRSTPGTSVDSATSNQPQVPRLVPALDSDSESMHHKHSKLNLSNKLRRALNFTPSHDGLMHGSIPELGVPKTDQKLKSSSASVAGVRVTSRPVGSNSLAPQAGPGQGRRFGFLNPKANSSTDNLSISSTVSSASVMIRKLGNLGKTARRNSMMGLTKIFKDKNSSSTPGAKVGEEKAQNSKKPLSHAHKNTPSTSVAQVNAEIDRSLENTGMTPAAAFIHQQKKQFAEQERAAAAAAAASSHKSGNHGSNAANTSSAGSGSLSSANEARKKMIEKEKEKLKSKKTRKWGFGGSSSSASLESNPLSGVVPPAVDEVQPLELVAEGEDDEEWDDRTVRGSNVEASVNSAISGNHDPVEELGCSENDENLSEYDAESLFGGTGNDGSKSDRRPKLRPRPSKEAAPKKGILKNAKNFSQNNYLPTSFALPHDSSNNSSPKGSLKLASVKNGLDSSTSEDFGASGLVIELGDVPDLRLQSHTLRGIRRATFAQNLSVHSTWPPAIYDRRGEPATCNRLTPTLAQRIKEELNAFKMEEMEVHYASRTHTHFFV